MATAPNRWLQARDRWPLISVGLGGASLPPPFHVSQNVELFRSSVEKGEVLELQNASHFVMQSNQRQVLDAIETFSARLP